MATPRLGLTEIAVGQAAKEIAHNEALRVIDALMSGKAITLTATTPPSLPTEGDVHIVAPGSTGAWLGQDEKIAHFYANAWYFYTAKTGMTLWCDEIGDFIIFDGASWVIKTLPVYTVATLPAQLVGRMIYVSDDIGGATPAFSDGTNWRRVSDLNIVS